MFHQLRGWLSDATFKSPWGSLRLFLRKIEVHRIDHFGQYSEFLDQKVKRNDHDGKCVQVMRRLEQEHGIWVNDQPIDGEADDGQQRDQKSQQIQRKHRTRQIPKTLLLLLHLPATTAVRRPLLKIQTLLQLLNESHERKRANDDGDEIEERVRDDKVNDEGVGFPHVLQMMIALEAEQRRRDGEG